MLSSIINGTILEEIGAWLAVNGDSVYGCGSAELPKPDWGWYTKKNGHIYAHILDNPIGPLALTGLAPERVNSVRRLADGSEVLRGESWITNAYENLASVSYTHLSAAGESNGVLFGGTAGRRVGEFFGLHAERNRYV